eukprot:UN29004
MPRFKSIRSLTGSLKGSLKGSSKGSDTGSVGSRSTISTEAERQKQTATENEFVVAMNERLQKQTEENF